jgi:elongation factor Ts
MADITVAQIRKVREITGAGMTDVKKALVEADGDEQTAIDELRKKGASKAVKRGADRVASNGLIAAAEGALIEVACETDFVAKNEQLVTLAGDIVAHAAAAKPADLPALLAETLVDGRTVEQSITEAAAALGEKLELRRYARLDGHVATYLHKKATDLPPQIGVIVAFEGEGAEAAAVARQTAMQVSAVRSTQYLTRDEVPAVIVERERGIAEEIAKNEGKPEAAIPRIVEGRVTGFFKDVVLLEQGSVIDTKKTVKQLLTEAGATVTAFVRFEVGEA